MRRLRLRVLQTGAFVRKEVVEVVRQPRLLVVLVLGPFAILVLFGVGYREDVRRYEAVLVVPDGAVAEQVQANVDDLERFVDVDGIVEDEAGALDRLAEGDVDLVVVFPGDPVADVLAGERATIRVVHDRLDPIERTAIDFAAQLAVDQVNARALAQVVSRGQELAGPFTVLVDTVAAGWEEVAPELRTDPGRAQPPAQVAALVDDAARLDLAASALAALVADLQETPDDVAAAADDLATTASELHATTARLAAGATAADVERVDALVADATEAVTILDEVDAEVLVQPFAADVDRVRADVGITDYYAPGAVVLLAQHLGITLGALSFVRDKRLGMVEIFQVAPVSRLQLVMGKLVGQLVLGGAVTAALVALVVGVLGVPMDGDVGDLALVLGAVMAASLAIGAVLSLLSATDAQAIQWTMLALLATLFFSGFFLSVDQLDTPARVLSWALPATWGIREVIDVMLRGHPVDWVALAALGGGWLASTVVAMHLVRTRLGVR